jgi:hypothetical protein
LRGLGEIRIERVDRVLTNEVRVIKQMLINKRPKLLLEISASLVSIIERTGDLDFDRVKSLVFAGTNVVSIVAKMNERAKASKEGKMYTSKKIQLQKGSYPTETAMMLGIIQTILNADEIYTPYGQCLVVTPRDYPDSDDFLIYLIYERPKKVSKEPLDLNKKSEL